ncbi:hypothetical protein TCAL_01873 [Tigriopus californicus]|uniref:Uncharacterized protein n=1 Tax=Tigriopus californicus TaxID=6832 RepID=A0A553P5P0_TIGCA|nr:hypothetical protein TCAL_01873 [Tigriopus californicus]|eukprot:TCALIF_01873-PA protein Name:"Protein of unknown function" AED:0.00 eAED:0.00 QI:331/1/1/1/0.66/0.5/4/281/493
MKSLRFTISCLLAFTSTLSVVMAIPLPQSLTEEQFRGFGDELSSSRSEESAPEVRIHSGYSRVMRFGRGFAHGPLRGFGPVTVKDPYQFQNQNEIQRVTYDDDKAPVFDLQKMLEEQAIKKAIEEANRKELMADTTTISTPVTEALEETTETVEESTDEPMEEVTTERVEMTTEDQDELEKAAEMAVEELQETADAITETFSGTLHSFDETLNNLLNKVDEEEANAVDEIDELKARFEADQEAQKVEETTVTEQPEDITRRNPLAEIELDDVFDPFALEIQDDDSDSEATTIDLADTQTRRNPLEEIVLDDVFDPFASEIQDDDATADETTATETTEAEGRRNPLDEIELDDVFDPFASEIQEDDSEGDEVVPDLPEAGVDQPATTRDPLAEVRLDDVFIIPEESQFDLSLRSEDAAVTRDLTEIEVAEATESNEVDEVVEGLTPDLQPEDVPRRPPVVFDDDTEEAAVPEGVSIEDEEQPPQEIDLGSVQEV